MTSPAAFQGVEELFEARSPKGQAHLVEIDGVVQRVDEGDERRIRVNSTEEFREEYPLPTGYRPTVADREMVEVGTTLASPEETPENSDRGSSAAAATNSARLRSHGGR